MTVTREQEIWAVALHVEKIHGEQGPAHIAEKIGRMAMLGDEKGLAFWRSVASRYAELTAFSGVRSNFPI